MARRGVVPGVLLAALAGIVACAASGGAAPVAYGTRATFVPGRELRFPDFTLVYQGRRRVVPARYPRGWWAHDFVVRAGDPRQEQVVTWSAGTGAIGPAVFEAAGGTFWLELARSDRLGPLREDELVVTRVASPPR